MNVSMTPFKSDFLFVMTYADFSQTFIRKRAWGFRWGLIMSE